MKKDIYIRLTTLWYYDIEGDLDEIIERLQSIKKEYPGYESYRLDFYDKDSEDASRIDVKGIRLETDQEYQTRRENEKRAIEDNKKYKLDLYEKLKKELGK